MSGEGRAELEARWAACGGHGHHIWKTREGVLVGGSGILGMQEVLTRSAVSFLSASLVFCKSCITGLVLVWLSTCILLIKTRTLFPVFGLYPCIPANGLVVLQISASSSHLSLHGKTP